MASEHVEYGEAVVILEFEKPVPIGERRKRMGKKELTALSTEFKKSLEAKAQRTHEKYSKSLARTK